MNNFIFENATKVYFGKGCVKEYLSSMLLPYGDTVLFAYGGGSIKQNGIYDEVTALLKAAGKNIIEFTGIMANPTYAKVMEGAKLAREHHVDVILVSEVDRSWIAAKRYHWPPDMTETFGRNFGPDPALLTLNHFLLV